MTDTSESTICTSCGCVHYHLMTCQNARQGSLNSIPNISDLIAENTRLRAERDAAVELAKCRLDEIQTAAAIGQTWKERYDAALTELDECIQRVKDRGGSMTIEMLDELRHGG